MSNKIKSPNTVFTETDKSQTFQAPEITDFVVIGRTPKGRCYVPTIVENYQQYSKYFGGVSRNEYTGITVKETLLDADSIAVVSIGGTEDYDLDHVFEITQSGSTLAQLYLSAEGIAQGITSASFGVNDEAGNLDLKFFSGSTEVAEVTGISLFVADEDKYIGNYDNPLAENNLFYTKYKVDLTDAGLDGSGSVGTTFSDTDSVNIYNLAGSTTYGKYDEGETPWVVSQTISNANYKLFKFETLAHGDQANRDVKISVINVRSASDLDIDDNDFGLFDVLVRDYSDTDNEPVALEQYNNLSLNPQSVNYIARRIGDLKREYNTVSGQVEEDGVYENSSEYIRVVMDYTDKPDVAIPFGFEGYNYATKLYDPNIVPAYIKFPESGSGNYSGVDFDTTTYIDDLHSELPKSTSEGFTTADSGSTFVLSSSVSAVPEDDRKFTFGFQGGSIGINEATESLIGVSASVTNTFGLDFTDTTSDGYLAYKKAIDTVSDKELFRFKTLSLAGLTLKQHGNVFTYAFDMAKSRTRGEIVVLADPTEPNSNGKTNVSDIETTTNGAFDSSHGSAIAPWFWYNDSEIGRVLAPQGALMPRTLAHNDRISAPWYAAFGFERGAQGGYRPYTRYNIGLRDRLHDARVNSVIQIVGEPSPVVMNNRTLQRKDSALSFLNVRRLVNEAKIQFDIITRKYYGRPFTPATRNNLASEIKTYLSRVQSENGLETYEAIFDDSVQTQQSTDQAIIRGVVFLVPIKGVQGIEIGFVVGKSGTTFEENR
jgi:hypothetical protein